MEVSSRVSKRHRDKTKRRGVEEEEEEEVGKDGEEEL